MSKTSDIEEWYLHNNANHAHCPCCCEHPQPFVVGDIAYCNRCWSVDKKMCQVIPCNSDDVCNL